MISRASRLVGLGNKLLALTKKFEITIATKSAASQIVLDDENWNVFVFGNNDRTKNAAFRIDHVIALFANQTKAIFFKNASE